MRSPRAAPRPSTAGPTTTCRTTRSTPEAGLQALWASSGTTCTARTPGGRFPFTRDKLFFFVSYEGYRQIQAAFLQAFVPTAAERGGDFSADMTAGAVSTEPPTTIFDPTSYTTNCPTASSGTACSGANILTQWTYNGHPNMINPAMISKTATYVPQSGRSLCPTS